MLILIDRIDSDIAMSAGAECAVDPVGVGVRNLEEYRIRQHVPGSHNGALQVQRLIEKV